MGRKEMSAEMEWWLCEPEGDRELIGLIRKLTINEQNEMKKRLKDLSEQTPVFEYKKFRGHDLPLTIP
jgi:hypothetical protein